MLIVYTVAVKTANVMRNHIAKTTASTYCVSVKMENCKFCKNMQKLSLCYKDESLGIQLFNSKDHLVLNIK